MKIKNAALFFPVQFHEIFQYHFSILKIWHFGSKETVSPIFPYKQGPNNQFHEIFFYLLCDSKKYYCHGFVANSIFYNLTLFELTK